MSGKKIGFGSRPAKPEVAKDPATWVEQRHEPEGKQRLTLDIPASLHSRIKAQCAQRGEKMIDAITAILEREFPEERR